MSAAQALATGTSLFGSALGFFSGRDTNKKNLQIAREQMAFQERMSNTSHFRAARDLERAGLNRILALGSGASTPGGAAAQMVNPVDPSTGDRAVTTGLDAKRAKAELRNLEATYRLIETDVQKRWAEVKQVHDQNQRTRAETEMIRESLKGARIEGKIDESKFGETMRYLNRLNPFAGTAKGVLKK